MTTCWFYLDKIIGADQHHGFIHTSATYLQRFVLCKLIDQPRLKDLLENIWKRLEILLVNIKGGVIFGAHAQENCNTDLLSETEN